MLANGGKITWRTNVSSDSQVESGDFTFKTASN
jgi:hypothetical protein